MDDKEKIRKYLNIFLKSKRKTSNVPIPKKISSDPRGRLLYRAYKKHLVKGLDFNLTLDDIEIPEICPYLECELSTDPKDCKKAYYATVDRIDNAMGYVKGNVRVISMQANKMKSNAPIEDLRIFCGNGLRLHPKKAS